MYMSFIIWESVIRFRFLLLHRLGLGDMLDAGDRTFSGTVHRTEEDDDRPRVAIVGKPNVGKSSIINKSAGREPCDRI